ncbi:FAD-dependent oxidoreductase [Nocardioides panacisoli]|uniref:FAD-dependent oxidoreductase n=1 Tax=Nocardioides panacisoli TaxID=627624 RepID=UPI001C62E00B|nr:FAD-dependent oxidoreductase [Nocardioides panacisoli]QYJ03332.1 FAD-dependent oxidoreductase [Nocardioides panacisoli]
MALPNTADVVVVGAGLAGLAAATRLQQAGIETVLVEQSDGVGGRVRTDVVDGYRLDRGFQLLNPAYPEAQALLDLDALVLQSFDAGLVVASGDDRHLLGDPRRLPRSLPADLTAPVGTLRQKLALLRWLGPVGLGPASRVRAAADRPFVDELRARGLDGDLTDRALRPFLSGVLAEEELQSSQRMVSLLLRAFVRGTPAVPSQGMQAMPDQLAAKLAPDTLHLGVRVTGLTGGGVDTDQGSIRARAVVSAVDGVAATDLGAPGSAMRALTTWWYAAEEAPHSSALLHVDGDRDGPLANTVVVSNAAPTYAPVGRALVAATAVGTHPEATAEAEARAQAARLLGDDPTRWELLRSDVITHALPTHPAGQSLRQPVALGDGRFVCGDHRDTPSIQGALVSGRRTADAVRRALGRTAT